MKVAALPKGAVFTGLIDPDGTEKWISTDGEVKEEVGPEVYVPPGKVEAPTNGQMSYEITSGSIVKEGFVDVWNDVEGSHYRTAVPLYVGSIRERGPWFFVDCTHLYIGNKRVFTVYLENWSHTWGRRFQIHLKYEIAPTVIVTREEDGTRVTKA